MLHIGVCDDDPLFISLIVKVLRAYCAENNLKSEIIAFEYPNKMLQFAEENSQLFDIVFLDIDMPGMDGHILAQRLRSLECHFELVFVTSHENLMQHSFRYLPREFIVKDELQSRIPKIMPVLIGYIQKYRTAAFTVLHVRENYHIGTVAPRPFYLRVSVKDIRFCEVVSGKLFVDIDNVSYILKDKTFAEFSKELENRGFIRIYRGMVVNPEHIKIIEQSNVVLLNDDRLRLSRYLRKAALKSFSSFVRQSEDWGH